LGPGGPVEGKSADVSQLTPINEALSPANSDLAMLRTANVSMIG